MNKIEVLSVVSINDLAERLPYQRPHFLLFLAWDALEMPPDKLVDLLRPLVHCGLVYFCGWGNRCEAVHDAIDECGYEKHAEAGIAETDDSVLMTTWHSRESLAEALWFFKVCAKPARSFYPADCDRLAVAVGNPDWTVEMEREVRSIVHDADSEVEPSVDDEED